MEKIIRLDTIKDYNDFLGIPTQQQHESYAFHSLHLARSGTVCTKQRRCKYRTATLRPYAVVLSSIVMY